MGAVNFSTINAEKLTHYANSIQLVDHVGHLKKLL